MSKIYRVLVERGNSIYGTKVIAEDENSALEFGKEWYKKYNIHGLTSVIDGEVSICDEASANHCKEKYDELKTQGASTHKLEDAAMETTKYLPVNDKWFEGKLKY